MTDVERLALLDRTVRGWDVTNATYRERGTPEGLERDERAAALLTQLYADLAAADDEWREREGMPAFHPPGETAAEAA